MLALVLGVTPVLIVLFYVYIRDKYEKEPVRLLIVGVVTGIVITYPIIHTAAAIAARLPPGNLLLEVFFTSFIVAAFTETAFKFAALYLLTWENRNLNEPFDGIVYSVFIALGFAGVENVLYIFHPSLGGMETALVRFVISVPAHALFAVTTGYYFAMAKFERAKKARYLFKAFAVTMLLHGAYDFFLLSERFLLMFLFPPLLIYMWYKGFAQMKAHLEISPFKPKITINKGEKT